MLKLWKEKLPIVTVDAIGAVMEPAAECAKDVEVVVMELVKVVVKARAFNIAMEVVKLDVGKTATEAAVEVVLAAIIIEPVSLNNE